MISPRHPAHFCTPPAIRLRTSGALGIGSSGFLFFLIKRVVSLAGCDVKCSDWIASSSSMCCDGYSYSVLGRFLSGLLEPTDDGAVDLVI